MPHPLFAHFMKRADEVRDVATLEWDVVPGFVLLRPHRDGALGVHVEHHPGDPDELLVNFDAPWAWVDDVEDEHTLDEILGTAIEGRLRVLHGPGRRALEHRSGAVWTSITTSYDALVPLPRPGWRTRARVVDFLPYRA